MFQKKIIFFCLLFLYFIFIDFIYSQQKENKDFNVDTHTTILANILAATIHPDTQLDLEDKYKKIINSNAYKNHYKEMKSAWDKTENKRLKSIRKWVDEEINNLCNENFRIFYPFSGPDILNAEIFFPCGNEFILFGLEPPGYVRDITNLNPAEMNKYLYYIRDSLRSILNYSFFRTNEMKVNFFKELDGLTPVLLTFLAYNKNEIYRITKIQWTPDGIVEDSNIKNGIQGVRIYYKNKTKQKEELKFLTYLQIDVSNKNLDNHKFFLDQLKQKKPFITFIKAASYLMYNDSFSYIRDFILNNSYAIIQDDSGIPVKYFLNSDWNLKFYGNYIQPIPLFKNRYQPELRKIYLDKTKIHLLPFGTGYNFSPGTSNLMVAEKIQSR